MFSAKENCAHNLFPVHARCQTWRTARKNCFPFKWNSTFLFCFVLFYFSKGSDTGSYYILRIFFLYFLQVILLWFLFCSWKCGIVFCGYCMISCHTLLVEAVFMVFSGWLLCHSSEAPVNLYLQLFIILKLSPSWWLQSKSVLSHQANLEIVSGVSAMNLKKILFFVEEFRWWNFSWIYKKVTVNCVRSNVIILFLGDEEDSALHFRRRNRTTFKAQHCHCITIFFHKVSWIR